MRPLTIGEDPTGEADPVLVGELHSLAGLEPGHLRLAPRHGDAEVGLGPPEHVAQISRGDHAPSVAVCLGGKSYPTEELAVLARAAEKGEHGTGEAAHQPSTMWPAYIGRSVLGA